MSTDLDGALADPSYEIHFDGVTTAARANIATHGDAEGAMESPMRRSRSFLHPLAAPAGERKEQDQPETVPQKKKNAFFSVSSPTKVSN